MANLKTFVDALKGMWSLCIGLKITSVNFCQPTITVHFPRQEVDNLDTFRGHLELVAKDDDPFTPRCVSCGMCADVCPSNCIKLTVVTEELPPEPAPLILNDAIEVPGAVKAKPPKKAKKKRLERFDLDFTLCSLCGQCAQSCPGGSLRFSNNAYLIGTSREELQIELMGRMRKQAEAAGGKPAPAAAKTGEEA